MDKEEEVDRRRGEKIIVRSGQGWNSLAQPRQLKTRLLDGTVAESCLVFQLPRKVMGWIRPFENSKDLEKENVWLQAVQGILYQTVSNYFD